MNFSLWDPPDVVVGRVGGLLHEQERDSLEELVAGHGRDGQVEEEPVQHREGDEVHWTEMRIMISFYNYHSVLLSPGYEVDRGSDENVGHQVTHSRLSHLIKKKTPLCLDIWMWPTLTMIS